MAALQRVGEPDRRFEFLGVSGCSRCLNRTEPDTQNLSDATFIVVPLEVPNPTMDAGCWVQLWSGPHPDCKSSAVMGPAEILATDQGTIRRLQRNVGSLLTGPKAKLTVFANRSLTGKFCDVPPTRIGQTSKRHLV